MLVHTHLVQNTEYRIQKHRFHGQQPATCARHMRQASTAPSRQCGSKRQPNLAPHASLSCRTVACPITQHTNCQLPTDETGQKPSPTRATASRCRTTATIMFQTGTCRSSSVRHKPSLVSLHGWHCCAVALPARLTLCRDAQRAPCLKLQIQPRRPTSDAVTQPQWHNRTGASAWPESSRPHKILAAQKRTVARTELGQDSAPAADASAHPEHHGAVGRKNIGCEA